MNKNQLNQVYSALAGEEPTRAWYCACGHQGNYHYLGTKSGGSGSSCNKHTCPCTNYFPVSSTRPGTRVPALALVFTLGVFAHALFRALLGGIS